MSEITHLMGFTEEETKEILKDQRREEAMTCCEFLEPDGFFCDRIVCAECLPAHKENHEKGLPVGKRDCKSYECIYCGVEFGSCKEGHIFCSKDCALDYAAPQVGKRRIAI